MVDISSIVVVVVAVVVGGTGAMFGQVFFCL